MVVAIQLDIGDARVTSVRYGCYKLCFLPGRWRQDKSHAVGEKGRGVGKITTCGKMSAHFREETPPRRGISGAKDRTHWNTKKFHENEGKNDGEIRMIQHSVERCVHVITKLQDIFVRMGYP
ncbi:MAG: hypothetical protein MZW92_00755 [Comamonadaceae bacterium]|nr:hypothetical protein [Comamonadaceae bacterium]